MKKIFDREKILQFVNKQEWPNLIEVFKDNDTYDSICSDSVLMPIIDQYFLTELLNSSNLNNDPAYKYYLEQFSLLHSSRKFKFTLKEDDYKKLIVKIVEVEKSLEYAYKYAVLFPEELICKQVIQQYNDLLPQYVEHSQEGEIQVTENKNIRKIDARIGLFKSRQEYQFYRSTIEVFPNFLVIPNVALSAIINFNLVKEDLNKEEKSYFFKALIDCAVIDTEDNFKSIRLIELDSIYHDNEDQIHRDQMKDNILAIAGQKLIRVRCAIFQEGETDFSKLIRETLK